MKINVTEYKTAPGEYIAYYGRAMLKKGYTFANGDEFFYHMIGKNSCYPMTELLHPDDVDEFIRMAESLGTNRESVILRMKDADNNYRLLYMELWLNGTVFDGFRSISFEFCNFIELKDRYILYTKIVKKYREFMSLSQNIYFEYTPDTDVFNMYRYVNLKSQPMLKRRLEEIHDELAVSEKFGPKSRGEFQAFYEALKNGMDKFNMSFDAGILLEGAGGRIVLKGSAFYDNGSLLMMIGIMEHTDNTDAPKRYYLTDSAYDPGTGLWNKRAIHEYAIEKTHEGRSLYIGIMDVDDFKKVNDTQGHMFGDEVLSKVSETLRGVIDSRGAVGRFGGDEFMLVFDSVSDEEELRRILKTISKNIQWAFRDLADTLPITTSCGVAKMPDDGTHFEELFQKADKALYIAKAKGKNRFIIYDEAKHGSIVNEDEADRSVGIKAVVSDRKKAAEMSKVVVSLHTRGAAELPAAMEKLRSYFDVDGVTVYRGEDLHRTLTAGKYINPIQKLDFIANDSYLELFDENGVFEEQNIKTLSNTRQEAYKLYELQETPKFIQFAAYRDNKPAAVVAFDYFNRTPKIGTTDMGLMTIVGRLMAEAACGLGES